MNTSAKIDFPVSDIQRFLEPGPIVLVSSAWKGRTNITTMGWHMLMEFQPSLVGCVLSSANHSFRCAGGRAGPHEGHSVNQGPETPLMVPNRPRICAKYSCLACGPTAGAILWHTRFGNTIFMARRSFLR